MDTQTQLQAEFQAPAVQIQSAGCRHLVEINWEVVTVTTEHAWRLEQASFSHLCRRQARVRTLQEGKELAPPLRSSILAPRAQSHALLSVGGGLATSSNPFNDKRKDRTAMIYQSAVSRCFILQGH